MNAGENKTGLVSYYPEMGEKEPAAEIRASLGHYGKHWFCKTRLELKGRGIKFIRTLKESDLVESAKHRAGENEYKVTEAAFDMLTAKYKVSTVCLL